MRISSFFLSLSLSLIFFHRVLKEAEPLRYHTTFYRWLGTKSHWIASLRACSFKCAGTHQSDALPLARACRSLMNLASCCGLTTKQRPWNLRRMFKNDRSQQTQWRRTLKRMSFCCHVEVSTPSRRDTFICSVSISPRGSGWCASWFLMQRMLYE